MYQCADVKRRIRRLKQTTYSCRLVQIGIVIAMEILIGRECLAGTSRQRANAAIAVARAALEIADEQPALPDTKRNSSSPHSSTIPSTTLDSQTIKQSGHNAGRTSDRLDAQAGSLPSSSDRPMRLEMATAAIISEVPPAQLVIGGWKEGCPACTRIEAEIKRVLSPLGWTIGNHSTDQIRFVPLPPTVSVPQITLYQNGTVIKTWNQYIDAGALSQALRKAWDEAPPVGETDNTPLPSGSAGTLHAQSQIRAALNWWREQIGEHNQGLMIWDRSGAQTFSLLAKGDWSATALFGTTGHIDLSANGVRRLPIESAGFGYQIRGRDIIFDADPITLSGLADRLNPVPNTQFAGSVPVGFVDPLTAWNIFSMFQGIYELLYPSCDLQLPEQISATATLAGETLAIDFQQGPSIRLVALFTFQLKVQRVEVTETSVRLLFHGSRFVKERTFSVK